MDSRKCYRNICQRPTASKALRKCSIVGAVLVVGPDDRHDIEATPHFEHVVSAHELHRNVCQPPLFLRGDSLGGHALPPGLHLDENQRVAITRDQVDFTLPVR